MHDMWLVQVHYDWITYKLLLLLLLVPLYINCMTNMPIMTNAIDELKTCWACLLFLHDTVSNMLYCIAWGGTIVQWKY